MKAWTLSLLAVTLLQPGGGLDVSDMCTRCSCQYLASTHLTDTLVQCYHQHCFRSLRAMKAWTLSLLAVTLLQPGGGLDVSDMCTRCSCQYLASTHLTDTLVQCYHQHCFRSLRAMKAWTLSLLAVTLLQPGGGLDVSDMCTRCSCQYLASTHLTDTLVQCYHQHCFRSLRAMKAWTLSLLAVTLLQPGGGLDVSDMCTRCSCQYLASTHLTDTLCTSDHPVLEVNCTTRPKVKQNPNQFVNAPTTSASVMVWLSYKHAGLTSLQPLTLFEPFNVTVLTLDHNKLVFIPPRALVGLRNLSIVTASHNYINSVASDAFKGLRHLRYIDLSFNYLHTLDFKLVIDAVNLISLDVRNNSIKTIIQPLATKPSLETLDVSANKIPDFPILFFSSFPNLLQLNVSFNGLGTLTADMFHDLTILKVLDASGNGVKTLDKKVVENLKSLNRLYLNDNLLTDANFVEVLPSLNTLDLSHNNFSSLGDRLLSSKLQRLVVSHNHITDLSHVFKVFDKLKSLDAGWNPCAVFPEHVRAGLRELVLDGTLLSSWPAQRPGEGSIDHLSLSHIPGIASLGPFAFSGILKHKNESGKCASLKISNTSLSSIDEDAFTDLDICKLDLSHNRLRWVPEALLPWSSMVGVDLQGNPWHCDCALQWMLTSVVPAAYKSDQALLEDLRCASPPEVATVRLVHWYNHQDAALCGTSRHDAMLTSKARLLEPSGHTLVTVSSSPLMIAVLLCLSVVAAMLVILGFALQRRAVRLRKVRRNRRF